MDKKIIAVIAVVAALLVGGISAFALMGGSGSDEKETEYTLTYVTNGGADLPAVTFTKSMEVIPSAPSKENCAFLGWYDNPAFSGEKVIKIAKGTEKDITLYAKWQMEITGMPSASDFATNTSINSSAGANSAANPSVPGEIINAITEGKDLTVTNNDGTRTTFSWTFNGAATTQSGYTAGTAVPTAVTPSFDDEKKEVTLDFEYDGTLPYPSTIKYYVGDHFTAGQKVTIKNSGDVNDIGQYTVDSQGYVTFTITHCSDWVLTYYVEISFDAHGGKFAGNETKITLGGDFNASLTDAHKEILAGLRYAGYEFESWRSATGAPVDIAAIRYTEEAPYFATYAAITYSVAFNANDGSGSMSAQEFVYDADAVALTENVFTRVAYTFAGWNTKADGTGSSYADKQAVRNLSEEKGATVTVYAQWTPVEYTIIYNANGGTIAAGEQKYTIETPTFQPAAPVKEGATFAGWYAAENLSGEEVKSIVLGTYGDMTLYAKWTLTQYTIRFVTDGGNAVEPMKYTIESSDDLPVATKDGFAFGGWYTSDDLSGSPIYKIATGTTGNMSLYAKWTPFAVNVLLVLDGTGVYDGLREVRVFNGEASAIMQKTAPGTFRYESTSDFEITNGTQYTFKDSEGNILGTATVADGLGSANVDFWTLRFNSNGGSAVENIIVLNGTSATAPAAPIRNGYEFSMWKSENIQYDFSSTVTGTVDLIAAWIPVQYSVTFVTNGGTSVDPVVFTLESDNIAINAVTTKDGYTFAGWYSTRDLSGEKFQTLAKGTVGDITLYAKWDVQKYTATIVCALLDEEVGNVGQGWTQLVNYTKDFEYGTSGEAIARDFGATFSRMCYTFAGWQYSSETMGTEGMTIAPVFTAIRYTVIFDTNGGTGDVTAPAQYTVEDDILYPAYSGSRTGFNFANAWYPTPIVTSIFTGITADNHRLGALVFDSFSEGGVLTLYAGWTAINYSVVYNANGGTGEVPAQETNVNIGSYLTFPESALTKDGKFFGGWNTKADGSGTTLRGYTEFGASAVEFVDGTIVTLYANWVDAVYPAAVGDVFTYNASVRGSVSGTTTGSTTVISVGVNQIAIERFLAGESEGFELNQYGTYPDVFGIFDMIPENMTVSGNDTFSVRINGSTVQVPVTVKTGSLLGMNYTVKEDANGLIYYFNGGNLEYTMTSVATGGNNGYNPETTHRVTYVAGTQTGAASTTVSSSVYKTPGEIGMEIPAGMVFVGWYFGDSLFGYSYADKDDTFQPGWAVLGDRTVYAVWEEYRAPATNIDWRIDNLPAGLEITINGNDAFESNGVAGDYIEFGGATNWSYADGIYAFSLNGNHYYASVDTEWSSINGYITNTEDSPVDGMMRIRLLDKGDERNFKVIIKFWQEEALIPSYIPTVGDTFTFSNGEGTRTVTVTEIDAEEGCYYYSVNNGDSRTARFYEYPYVFGMRNPADIDDDYVVERINYNGVDCFHVVSKYVQRLNLFGDEYAHIEERTSFSAYYRASDGLCIEGFGYRLVSSTSGTKVAHPAYVEYNGNGGSILGQPTYNASGIGFGTEYQIMDAPSGKTLAGWNTRADGSGHMYGIEWDSFRAEDITDGRITLYAIWTFEGGYINFHGNNGQTVIVEQTRDAGLKTWYPADVELAAPANKAATYFRIDGLNFDAKYIMVKILGGNYVPVVNSNGTIDIDQLGSSSRAEYDVTKVNGAEVYYKYNDLSQFIGNASYNTLVVYIDRDATADINVVFGDAVEFTYYANDGTGASTTVSAAADGYMYTAGADTFARPGYILEGWMSAPESEIGAAVGICNLTSWVSSELGTSLYARWTPIMTIHYNLNGASGSIEDTIVKIGSNNTVARGNMIEFGAKYFAGWGLTANATTVAYGSSGTFPSDISMLGTEITLYAIWADNRYDISFDKNAPNGLSVSGSMSDQSVYDGITTKIKSNAYYVYRGSYAFAGWNTSADGSGTAYTDGQAVCLSADTTLYAQWTNEVTLVFDADGGVGTMASINTTIGAEFELPGCSFTKAGYRFICWYIGESYYYPEETYTVSGYDGLNITVRAYWQQVYTVTLNLNGGTYDGETTVSFVVPARENEFYINAAEKTGYTFGYWYVGEDDGTRQYEAYCYITVESDMVLNAFFMPIKYRIYFDTYGGETADGEDYYPVDAVYDQPYTIPASYVPTYEGYTFKWWTFEVWDDSIEDNIVYLFEPGNSYTDNLCSSDDDYCTVRAVWEEL